MSAKAALAFIARREGTGSMPASRWAHVMSLELGWMPPNQAGRYVAACRDAGLLDDDGDALRVTFDGDAVEVPRRFRPDPDALPAAKQTDDAPGGGFQVWAERLARHRGCELSDVLDEVAAVQDRMGGLLHAEAAVLRLMAEAGMDVRAEAEQELERLTRGSGPGSEG